MPDSKTYAVDESKIEAVKAKINEMAEQLEARHKANKQATLKQLVAIHAAELRQVLKLGDDHDSLKAVSTMLEIYGVETPKGEKEIANLLKTVKRYVTLALPDPNRKKRKQSKKAKKENDPADEGR
ncbi:MAG: hypothetical protein LBP55_10650 [Candidatus Adiutrix sp.]|jgi:uncharacterized protein YecA (UPF0149 family)|nr:hypothetical protein [Candidatus Adiutrix sp.]